MNGMRTVLKNELPIRFETWLQYCKFYAAAMNHDPKGRIEINELGYHWYINNDFAKARAFDEIVNLAIKFIL